MTPVDGWFCVGRSVEVGAWCWCSVWRAGNEAPEFTDDIVSNGSKARVTVVGADEKSVTVACRHVTVHGGARRRS